MHIVRRFGLVFTGLIFGLLLLATAVDIGLLGVVTHPAMVKQTIADSGVYSEVVPGALHQAGIIRTGYGDIKADSPLVSKAASSAIPPAFIRQNTEMAIDNTYAWLNGKLAAPNFKIDLSNAKTLFANKVANAVQARMNRLPACSLQQSRQVLLSGHYDALNSSCLPFGINAAVVAEQLQASLVNGQGFLPDTTLSASDIKTGGKPVFAAQLKPAPKAYQRLKDSQAVLILLTVMTGIAVMFLSADWRRGLFGAGIILVVSGVVLFMIAWGLGHTAETSARQLDINNLVLQQDVRHIILSLAHQVARRYRDFGDGYLGLGAAALAGAIIIRRREAGKTKGAPVKGRPPARKNNA